jgi:hypothetical protein
MDALKYELNITCEVRDFNVFLNLNPDQLLKVGSRTYSDKKSKSYEKLFNFRSYSDLDLYQHLQKGLTGIVTAYIKCGTKTMPGLLQSVHPTRLPQDTHEYALRFEVLYVPNSQNSISRITQVCCLTRYFTSCNGIGTGCSTIGVFPL